MTKEGCGNCKFYSFAESVTSKDSDRYVEYGRCQRYPPKQIIGPCGEDWLSEDAYIQPVVVGKMNEFPEMVDWCGEYQRND